MIKDPKVYKENKIVYKFTKQAFLKAYLAAWRKWHNPVGINSALSAIGATDEDDETQTPNQGKDTFIISGDNGKSAVKKRSPRPKEKESDLKKKKKRQD